jgi:hypothetical protein
MAHAVPKLISANVVENARTYVAQLHKEGIEPLVSAVVGGGICVEHAVGPRQFNVEFQTNGWIVWSYRNSETGEHTITPTKFLPLLPEN